MNQTRTGRAWSMRVPCPSIGEFQKEHACIDDDNPMQGNVFGGKKILGKKIYRW
jgi:hypothetical protein